MQAAQPDVGDRLRVGRDIARATARRAAIWPRALAVAAFALAGAAVAAPAFAHPVLMWSDPPAGSAVPQPVDRIVLSFSEAIEQGSAEVTLVDRAGKVAYSPKSVGFIEGDATTVTALFDEWIERGDLIVQWKVVSAIDAHLITGQFEVHFGSSVPVKAGAPAQQGAATSLKSRVAPLASAVRAVTNYAVALLVGGTTFVVLVWPNGLSFTRLRRFLWIALATAMATTAVGFGLQAFEIAGHFGAGAFAAAIGTRPGAVAAARFVALPATAGPLLAHLTRSGGRAARSPWWRGAAVASAVGFLASLISIGHAAGGGAGRIIAGVVHLGGVSVWLGGLVVIALVVLPRRRLRDIQATLPRFSALAGTAFSAAAVGGVLIARSFVGDWRTLGDSSYGRFLVLKTLIVVLILAAAAGSRTIVRRLTQRSGHKTRFIRPLTATVVTEVVLATVVVGVTAMLATRPLPVPGARFLESPPPLATTGGVNP